METLLVPIIIFVIAIVPRLLAAHRIDITWDEGLYALSGMTALKNLKEFNFSPDAWNFEFHPPVIMYLFGITYATYVLITTMLKRGFHLGFNLLYETGISLFTGSRTLLVIRLPSVILGSLSCVLTYLICLDVFESEMLGIFAALFLALTPSFLSWSSLAMLESGLTFFYLFTIWSLLRALQYGSIGYIIISGISLGLTLGSKETGFGLPLATLPWLALSLLKGYLAGGLGVIIVNIQLLLLWSMVGLAIFYLTWPLLWRSPIRQFMRNLRSVSQMSSEGGYSFYFVNLLSSTSILLVFLYGLGTLNAIQLAVEQTILVLFLSLAFLPIILMSMPFIPKRGEFEITFVLPAFSILAGLATQNISKIMVVMFDFGFYSRLIPLLLGMAFVGFILFECTNIHPYYMNYCNFVGKLLNKVRRGFSIGCWGEGMGQAIAYIDQHAPSNSTVWIYGPKSTAIYHSSRVDLRRTIGHESLLHERTKAGFDVSIDKRLYDVRRGDLKFYFPYYYHGKHEGLDLEELRAENVSYILVYRWATCDPAITLIDSGNNKIISSLRSDFTPVFTVKIKDIEVSWVYKIDDFWQ